MDDDVPISDSESEAEGERETTHPNPDTCHSQELLRGEFTPRKLLEDGPRDEFTPDVSEPRTLQDSELNAEQTPSSQNPESLRKEEDCDKASNGSGSSFEEIMMENVPLPQASS
jgi:hypothetical protein